MSPIRPAKIVTGPLVWLDAPASYGPVTGATITGPLILAPAEDDPLWHLSFADPGLPAGSQFLGVVIVQAQALEDAVTRSHVLGVNPGGEIQVAGPIPPGFIGPEWRDRLLSKAEAEAIPEPEGLAT